MVRKIKFLFFVSVVILLLLPSTFNLPRLKKEKPHTSAPRPAKPVIRNTMRAGRRRSIAEWNNRSSRKGQTKLSLGISL